MIMPTISRGQFEKNYAHTSGTTVEHLHEIGMHAEPCECDYEECNGWKMVSQ